MRPIALAATLSTLIDMRRPVLVEGSPGLGKTQIIASVAKQKGLDFLHFHAPTMQPEDWAMPAPTPDRTAINFLVNSRFPIQGRDGTPDAGVLLIDEAPQAETSIQKSIANLIQEREIYGQKLKDGWSIIMTGNRTSDRAGANRILSHLRNRVTTIEFEPSLDDWCDWALSHGVRPEIVQFLRFKPNLLNEFDPNRDINPTPRAWTEGVSPLLGKMPLEAEFEVIKGAVGEGAAAEATAFLKIYRELPDPDAVLKNPDAFEIPKELSVCYALAGAIAHRADEKNFDAVMQFSRRMRPEFAVMVVVDAVRKCPAVQQTKAFTDWARKDGARVLV